METGETVQATATEEGITTICINRPLRRNAVDPATARQLYRAFRDFDADSSQKVCVFYGADGNFCAGYDLQYLSSQDSRDSNENHHGPVIAGQRTMAPMGPSRLQTSKPIICAVEGYAVAGGLELSLLGDIRVAGSGAIFGVFCRRFGVPLIDGGTVRLQAIIGLGRAMDMILTGRPVDANEALQMGLANRVVAKGKAVETAMQLARQIMAFPQHCLRVDRESCYYAAFSAKSVEDALAKEYSNGVAVTSSESLRGAAAFAGGSGRHGVFESIGKARL